MSIAEKPLSKIIIMFKKVPQKIRIILVNQVEFIPEIQGWFNIKNPSVLLPISANKRENNRIISVRLRKSIWKKAPSTPNFFNLFILIGD